MWNAFRTCTSRFSFSCQGYRRSVIWRFICSFKYIMKIALIVLLLIDLLYGLSSDDQMKVYVWHPKISRKQSGGESKALMSGVERILKDGEYYFVIRSCEVFGSKVNSSFLLSKSIPNTKSNTINKITTLFIIYLVNYK